MRKFLLGLVAAAVLAVPANAQFIGFSSPQTVQQTLATSVACTGSAQNFNVMNLGQTQHLATAAPNSSIQTFTMVIQGIDTSGNVFNLSDVGQVGGAVQASGYMPITRVQVLCTPAVTGTFTIGYSGSSSTPPVISGAFLASQFDKLMFRGVPANVDQSTPLFTSPTGSSSGKLLAQYVTSGTTGSTLTINCQGSSTIGSYSQIIFTLANVTSIQGFNVPAQDCPSFSVGYGHGGSAVAINVEYLFDPPGLAPFSSQGNGCTTNNFNLGTITAISIGANSTQQVIAPFTGYRASVCGMFFTAGVAGTAQLTEGTGATCGTGSANVSGAMSLIVGTPVAIGAGTPIFSTSKSGDGLCITTAGGATLAGTLSFIYTPL